MGPGAAQMLAVSMAWRDAGAVDRTYRARVKRLAIAGRYGHAGEWMFRVDGRFLQDYVEALGEIVKEEKP